MAAVNNNLSKTKRYSWALWTVLVVGGCTGWDGPSPLPSGRRTVSTPVRPVMIRPVDPEIGETGLGSSRPSTPAAGTAASAMMAADTGQPIPAESPVAPQAKWLERALAGTKHAAGQAPETIDRDTRAGRITSGSENSGTDGVLAARHPLGWQPNALGELNRSSAQPNTTDENRSVDGKVAGAKRIEATHDLGMNRRSASTSTAVAPASMAMEDRTGSIARGLPATTTASSLRPPTRGSRQDETQDGQTAPQDQDPPFTPDEWIVDAVSSEVPLEFGSDLGQSQESDEILASLARLQLADVVDAAVQYYPMIQETIAMRDVAGGDQLAAMGAFDTKLKASSITMALGFYENHRSGVGAEQPLWSGGSVEAGYRVGRGDIQPWYQERVTNEGGEMAVGFALPLVKNRTIDDRRAELLQAEQDVAAVEPLIREQALVVGVMAAEAYWKWKAANAKLGVQQKLLDIALLRKSQIERTIELGNTARVANVDNLRLIATRQTALINAQRSVEAAAIKLSLFYRDAGGQPILIGQSLPQVQFPNFENQELGGFDNDQMFALQNRPELQYLANIEARYRIELQQARNIGLPELNLVADASKDVGAPSSSKRDKSQFELEGGLTGYWEPQQRKMLGKMQAVRGKLTQLQFKRQMVQDKITAELRDARSALNAARRKYQQTSANAALAKETANIFRREFEVGGVDLIILNIYEEAEAAAQSAVFDAQAEYLISLAYYAIAQGQLPE